MMGTVEPEIYFVDCTEEFRQFDEPQNEEAKDGNENEWLEDYESKLSKLMQGLTQVPTDPQQAADHFRDHSAKILELRRSLMSDEAYHQGLEDAQEDLKRDDDIRLGQIDLGASRLGGLPDLPNSLEWPMHNGKLLPFLSQLRLDEIPPQSFLPSAGWMYVFGWITDSPVVAVQFFSGDHAELVRTRRPPLGSLWADWDDASVYSPVPLRYKPASQLSADDGIGCYLFGNVPEWSDTAALLATDAGKNGSDWIAFLTIHSVGSMIWSDCGLLHLLARRSDLQTGNLGNILPAIASS